MLVNREGLKKVGCGRGKGVCAKDWNTKNANHSMQIYRNDAGQDDDHIKNRGSIIKNQGNPKFNKGQPQKGSSVAFPLKATSQFLENMRSALCFPTQAFLEKSMFLGSLVRNCTDLTWSFEGGPSCIDFKFSRDTSKHWEGVLKARPKRHPPAAQIPKKCRERKGQNPWAKRLIYRKKHKGN